LLACLLAQAFAVLLATPHFCSRKFFLNIKFMATVLDHPVSTRRDFFPADKHQQKAIGEMLSREHRPNSMNP
jgi:hypothetical protein